MKVNTVQSGKPASDASSSANVHTLAIDIGGTGLKAAVLDAKGEMITERVRVETPQPCPPKVLLKALGQLVAPLPRYDRVSVGFPGVVRHGKILNAHNLGDEVWRGFNLAAALAKQLGETDARAERCRCARFGCRQRPRRRSSHHARHRFRLQPF